MNNSSDIGWGVFFGFLAGLILMGMTIDISKGYARHGETVMQEQAVMMGHAHFKAKDSFKVEFKWNDCTEAKRPIGRMQSITHSSPDFDHL